MAQIAVEQIARLCHELNKQWCVMNGDYSQVSWDGAPEWQKESAIKGVEFALAGDRTPEEQHQAWVNDKVADGWVYGAVKDSTAKTHPCLVPYNELPEMQRIKDKLFTAIVSAFK